MTNYWCNVFRAIEIAKLGGLPITIIFNKEYNGYDDYQRVKDFCKGWFDDFKSDGLIYSEIYKPQEISKVKGESIKTIEARIVKAQNFGESIYTETDSFLALMNTAMRHLNMSLNDVDNVIKIAKVIAQLDLKPSVRIDHIAEAIQYSKPHSTEYYCIAENKKIVFNGLIEIVDTHIDTDVIDEAIEYLKSLKEKR
jgi:hypothetical protein